MVGEEADRELTRVTLTYHDSGPIYETSAQSTKFPGNLLMLFVHDIDIKCDRFFVHSGHSFGYCDPLHHGLSL